MSDERIVSAKMDVFRNAARKLALDFWTEYWEIKENKKSLKRVEIYINLR